MVSSPGESHPEALAELYVSLSTHTAPNMEPRRTPICQGANNSGARRENTGDPVRRSAQMLAQLLVFALGPKGKISI